MGAGVGEMAVCKWLCGHTDTSVPALVPLRRNINQSPAPSCMSNAGSKDHHCNTAYALGNCHSKMRRTGRTTTVAGHPPLSGRCQTAAEVDKGRREEGWIARRISHRTNRQTQLTRLSKQTSSSAHDHLQRECCRILRLCCWRQEQHNRSSGKEHENCGLHGVDK